jgi:MFS transporter, ACS family, D-galactonate transporter
VLVLVVALTALLGAAVHSKTAASGSSSPTTAASGQDDVRARLAAIQAAHGPAVAVIAAIDPQTLRALAANPNDTAALSSALGEVAREQGAGETEAQDVSNAVTNVAPQLAAVEAVPPEALTALQVDPTDQAAATAAIQAIMSKLHVTQAQAIQLLQSLATAEVQADLTLAQKYVPVLQSAQNDIPPADLAFLIQHVGDLAASGPTK